MTHWISTTGMRIALCGDCLVEIQQRNPEWPKTRFGGQYHQLTKGAKSKTRCSACDQLYRGQNGCQ